MNLNTLEKLLLDSVAGIKLCIEAKLINSALVLLYCGIDTASSLDLTYDKQSVHMRYTKWCETYMFKDTSFDFTALELYAARCGVIHETSVESTLSAQGKARRIIYAWGDSKVDTLREMSKLAQIKDYVAVQFEDLVQAYENGLNGFVASLRSNEERKHFAIKKAEKCLITSSKEEMKSLFEWGRSMLGGPIS
jgi:hypothetical protein